MRSRLPGTKTTVQAESISLRIQGIVMILFGILAVGWPGLTLMSLVHLFVAFLLIDGLVLLAIGLIHRSHGHTPKARLMFSLGVPQLVLGMILLPRPQLSFNVFILLLGLALIARGLFSFVQIIVGRYKPSVRAMHGLLGVMGVAVGIIVLMQPAGGGLAVVWAVGAYVLAAGITMFAISVDLARE